MEEEIILRDENVKISKTLAVINGISYPTNTISALAIQTYKPGCALISILVILILGIVLVALASLVAQQYIAAVVCTALAALIFYKWPKVSYTMKVRSAGSDTSVMSSRDEAYLETVRAAVEEAIRQRG